jgi:hypothetical protein
MKLNNSFTLLSIGFFFFCLQSIDAQTQAISSSYPNITEDRCESTTIAKDIRIRFTLPGVMGIGVAGTYIKPNIVYAYGEAGAGWTLKTSKEDTERNWISPWAKINVGYPIHFVANGSAKYYTSVTKSGNTTTSEFYRVKAPVHHYFVPNLGFHLNPVAYRIITQPGYTGSNGVDPVDKHYNSFQASVITAGLSYRSIIDAKVRVKDSNSGNIHSGRIRRVTGVDVGVVFATKDEIIVPRGGETVSKSEGLGYYAIFNFPLYSNNFELGIRSLGYNTKDNTSKAAQLHIGVTFHI